MLMYQAYYQGRAIGEIKNISQVRVINTQIKNIRWVVIL